MKENNKNLFKDIKIALFRGIKVVMILLLSIVVSFVIFQFVRPFWEAGELKDTALSCIAGCGGVCSNDLRNDIKGKNEQEKNEILSEYNNYYYKFSDEEIMRRVEKCKKMIKKEGASSHIPDGPFYPYNELIVK